jgi:hypothetical protein
MSFADRFWTKVGPEDANGCWPWLAASAKGYGKIWSDGPEAELLTAHRVSYSVLRGDIPDGHELHHLCESKSCINPAHLLVAPPSQQRKRFHRSCEHDERKLRTDGKTLCLVCRRERKRVRYATDPAYREKLETRGARPAPAPTRPRRVNPHPEEKP